MKKFIFCSILFILNCCIVLSQSIPKCDVETLSKTEANINKLTKREIKDFFLTFDDTCDKNVEYSEYRNELLFLVLAKHTKSFVKIIKKEKKELSLNKIFSELTQPNHDSIEFDQLLAKVIKINQGGKLKNQIIESIKKAQNNLK